MKLRQDNARTVSVEQFLNFCNLVNFDKAENFFGEKIIFLLFKLSQIKQAKTRLNIYNFLDHLAIYLENFHKLN
ncbi:hypothetical protein BpHYR1_020458 [Brachionus plicatilis]|uniref:Uncharacterized protein n=1 Tax=Brachionus plicatilis TaxID=10195 RepID=A0A3M7PY01_BRAPC|nr:hypothetical protein BpHYR1_020458 [Brachionus plicatilis]